MLMSRKAFIVSVVGAPAAVQAIAPAVFGVPVTVLAPREYVALGAARQAAWALQGTEPDWAHPQNSPQAAAPPQQPTPDVRAAYAVLREETP